MKGNECKTLCLAHLLSFNCVWWIHGLTLATFTAEGVVKMTGRGLKESDGVEEVWQGSEKVEQVGKGSEEVEEVDKGLEEVPRA
ncbi:hypothetical protein MUG91_G50n24 [Manis pentadactyla]|nr:hypothetical protein MUG91_G50n24 [Manis pentadactyla]